MWGFAVVQFSLSHFSCAVWIKTADRRMIKTVCDWCNVKRKNNKLLKLIWSQTCWMILINLICRAALIKMMMKKNLKWFMSHWKCFDLLHFLVDDDKLVCDMTVTEWDWLIIIIIIITEVIIWFDIESCFVSHLEIIMMWLWFIGVCLLEMKGFLMMGLFLWIFGLIMTRWTIAGVWMFVWVKQELSETIRVKNTSNTDIKIGMWYGKNWIWTHIWML